MAGGVAVLGVVCRCERIGYDGDSKVLTRMESQTAAGRTVLGGNSGSEPASEDNRRDTARDSIPNESHQHTSQVTEVEISPCPSDGPFIAFRPPVLDLKRKWVVVQLVRTAPFFLLGKRMLIGRLFGKVVLNYARWGM